MDDTVRCPRRDESPNPDAYPGPDTFEANHGLVSQARGCSYCGSMSPDEFMEAVRSGAELGPTDKNYKVYIKLPSGEAKFYFQHLAEAQRMEFFELYRAHEMAVGYPGHFYRLPFFIRQG